MLNIGLVVRLEARSGKEEAVRDLLRQSLPLVVEEPGTPVWLAVQTGASTFWIVDAHASEQDRQAHIDGAVAAAILERADELFSEPPAIEPSVVIGAKPAA